VIETGFISVDLYPYRAGSTRLATLLPEWAHVGGSAETLKRLADPQLRSKMTADLKILKLEEAVHKMTGLPAGKLRLHDRGIIKPGLAADLVVFDPATVTDTATYDHPHRYAKGIFHVIVNGRFVIRDAVHTGDRPGRILKPA